MQMTRKQKMLLTALAGIAGLLLIGVIALALLGGSGTKVPKEPTLPGATPSPVPSPTVAPSPTPSATPYRLPLVPKGTGATPENTPPAEQTGFPEQTPIGQTRETPVPATDSPSPEAGAKEREGVYSGQQKEFMAIGTQNGEAIAVLLVQVKPPDVTVLAIPCETLAPVYTLGADCRVERVDTAPLMRASARAETAQEGCWNLIWAVKNLTGYRAPQYLCVDFACMEAFFSYAPKIETDGGEITLAVFTDALNASGEERARRMAQLGVGAARYLMKVSLWELPGFKNATRGAFSSSLSVFELISLLHSLKSATDFEIEVLSTEQKTGGRVLSASAEMPF